MVRKTLRTVRAIRTSLARIGFRGGWVEAVRREDGVLWIQVRDGRKREHRFCFGEVLVARGIRKEPGFVHGAYVAGGPALDHSAENAPSRGERPSFRFSLVGEDALIEVTARTLRIDGPEESAPATGVPLPLPLS